jgi:hypothetical protein
MKLNSFYQGRLDTKDMRSPNEALKEIQRLIVEKDPNDDDRFLRQIWDICEVARDNTPTQEGLI